MAEQGKLFYSNDQLDSGLNLKDADRFKGLIARKENPDGSVEGDLGAFLKSDFLKGYLDYLEQRFPDETHFQEIPQVVEQLVLPIVATPNDAMARKVYVGSSLARYIARGMNDDHWTIASNILDEGKTWDPDVDIFVSGSSVYTLFDQLKKYFNIVEIAPDAKSPQRKKFVFGLGGFEIHASVGKILTSDIHNLILSIMEVEDKMDSDSNVVRREEKRIFHIDVSEISQDPKVVLQQKRKGETFDWQDLLLVSLTSQEDGRIRYYMPREVREVMFKPTPIVTRSNELAVLLEDSFRAIRMAAFHPLDGIKDLNGNDIDLVDFGRFAPFFTSDSILRLHYSILLAMQSKDKSIAKENLRLIQDECELCFRLDPLWTLASLRDVSIARLIPGVRHLTPYDWDAIMRSDRFALEVTSEGRLVSPENRDWDYVKRQRYLWRQSTNTEGRRHFNGLERFVMSLRDLGLFTFRGNTVEEMFLELWEESPSAADVEIASPDKKITVPDGYEPGARVGEVILLYPSGVMPETEMDVAADGRKITEAAMGHEPLQKRLLDARGIIRRNAMGTELEGMLDLSIVPDRIQSIEVVYSLLKRYHFLTPKLLKKLYEDERVEFTKNNFPDVVFDLKCLGLIRLYEQPRVHPAGHIETLAFYSLDTTPLHSISEWVNRTDFLEYLATTNHLSILSTVLLIEKLFKIPTIEALISLRKKDIEKMRNEINSWGFHDEVAKSFIADFQRFLHVYTEFTYNPPRPVVN